MTNETKENILKFVENHYSKLNSSSPKIFINWFGGEPTPGNDFIGDFMNEVKEICKKYSIILSSNIVTNGYLLTKENFLKLLDSGIYEFQVTLDGYKSNCDKLRILNGGKPTFDVIFNNLKDISTVRQDFKMNIRCNFIKKSIESALNLIDMYKNSFEKHNRFNIYFRPVYYFETKNMEEEFINTDLFSLNEGMDRQNHFSELVYGDAFTSYNRLNLRLPLFTQ